LEPIYILNVAVKQMSKDMDDNTMARKLAAFCANHSEELAERSIRRVTFLVLERQKFPKFFTFRHRDGYREDRIYRHLEPALAFQLELNRMKNYNLEAIPTANQKMHLYLGKAKVMNESSLDLINYLVLIIIYITGCRRSRSD